MSYGEATYGEVSYGDEAGFSGAPGFFETITEGLNLSGSINGSNNILEAFSDIFTVGEFILDIREYNTFSTDTINITGSSDSQIITNIVDSIRTTSNFGVTGSFSIIAIDSLNISNRVYVGFPTSIIDSLELTGTVVVNKDQFISILDEIEIFEQLATSAVFHNTITDSFTINESTDRFFSGIISEVFNLSETLVIQLVAEATANETVVLTDTSSGSIGLTAELLSSILIDNSTGTTSNLSIEVEDNINVTDSYKNLNIETYVMNPENYAVTKYTLGFTEATAFDNKFLFADGAGLYELGGTTDNGTAIVSTITTPALDFDTSNIKQIPSVMLGTNGTDIILKVSVDGSNTVHYEVTDKSSALMTKHIKLGKGLIGRYWQFSLITDSADFDLDTFEFYPIIFKRKHNG